jgi:signal peptidase I
MAKFRLPFFAHQKVEGVRIRQRTIFTESVPLSVKIVRGVVYALTAWLIVTTTFIRFDRVPSDVLAPRIRKGDIVASSKIAYALELPLLAQLGLVFHFGRVKRGDIIMMQDPRSESPHPLLRAVCFPVYLVTLGFVDLAPEQLIMRRVIGLPKERVEIRDKLVYINNEVLKEEWQTIFKDMRVLPATLGGRDNMESVIVPFGEYFVMGDNRDYATDSREFGCIKREALRARVLR